MSVEILRRAAALMRKRAERMPMPKRGYGMESKWTSASTMLSKVYGPGHRVLMESRQNCDPYDGVYAADYFASWHPAVAVAVADWLDEAADHLEAHRDMDALPEGATCPTAREGLECSVLGQALTVARAYLGERP